MKRLGPLCLFALLGVASAAAAHPAPFSYIDIRGTSGAVELTVVLHIFDVGHDLGVQPPERLLESAILSSRADDVRRLVETRLHLSADSHPLTGGNWSAPEPLAERQSLRVRGRFSVAAPPGHLAVSLLMFPYDPAHESFVNFYEGDTVATQAILDAGRTDIEYFTGTRQGLLAVARRFVLAGMEHILLGPDHLLFLFGLLLLGGTLRQFVLVVSAFTLVQVVTLGLAAFRIVTPSLRFVDPGIALSIVYLGADNLMVRGGRDVRLWIAAAFGFIHGFGFAGVFRDMDLSSQALGRALASFSVGVEIAQAIVVLAIGFALISLKARSEAASRRLAFAGSIVVIAAGTIWFIQRVFFPGGLA